VSNGPRGVQALIVVDMQAAFVSGGQAVPAAGALLVSVTALLRRARQEGALVVQLQNDGPPDEPGTPGLGAVPPAAGARRGARDPQGRRRRLPPDQPLGRPHGARRPAPGGVRGPSDMCVSVTARTALSLGYHMVLPHDAHAAYDIPAVPGLAGAVPHAMASRAAEWSLGGQADVIARAADIRFTPPGP
jgi:nicotinamidase-related amidase